jgi:hypothetical protein
MFYLQAISLAKYNAVKKLTKYNNYKFWKS